MDRYEERNVYDIKSRSFAQIIRKNQDSICLYLIRSFETDSTIKTITYASDKWRDITDKDVIQELINYKYWQLYEFKYRDKKPAQISSINYYRKKGIKYLCASNKYFYNKNNLVEKSLFEDLSEKYKIKGETYFLYFPKSCSHSY